MPDNEKITTIIKDDPEKDKKIQELEKKLGEQGKQLGEQRQFIEGAQRVINTVAHNPELRDRFREEYERVYEKGASLPDSKEKKEPEQKADDDKPNEAAKELNTRMSDVEMSRRQEIVDAFEDRVGISGMEKEEQAKVRGQIETFFAEMGGQSIKTLPITRLAKSLERAHTAVHAEKLREEGKLEGYAAAVNNQFAAAPSVGGGARLKPEESGNLTDAQASWAQKMGVDTDKAKKTYKDKDNEYRRVSAVEKKAKEGK